MGTFQTELAQVAKLTPENIAKVNALPQSFKDSMIALFKNPPSNQITITGVTVSGTTATLNAQSTNLTGTVTYVLEDGQWKLDLESWSQPQAQATQPTTQAPTPQPTNTSAPTISSISPNQGSVNTTFTIYGTKLSGTSEIQFFSPPGTPTAGSSQGTVKPVSVNSNNVTFKIVGSVFAQFFSPGVYQVKVVTPSGKSNGINFTFISTSSAATPTVTSIVQSQGSATTVANATIYGTNLNGATTIEFYNSSNQLQASVAPVFTSSDGTQTQFLLNDARSATAAGSYQIRVVASAGRSNAFSFTLTAP